MRWSETTLLRYWNSGCGSKCIRWRLPPALFPARFSLLCGNFDRIIFLLGWLRAGKDEQVSLMRMAEFSYNFATCQKASISAFYSVDFHEQQFVAGVCVPQIHNRQTYSQDHLLLIPLIMDGVSRVKPVNNWVCMAAGHSTGYLSIQLTCYSTAVGLMPTVKKFRS